MDTEGTYQGDRSVDQGQSSADPERGRQDEKPETAVPDSTSPTTGEDASLQSQPCTDAPGMLLPQDPDSGDPKLQLRTQLQQLSELSHLMSQRMTLSESGMSDVAAEAARGRAIVSLGPEAADPSSNCVAVDQEKSSDGVFSAQRTLHDPEHSLRVGEGPLLPAELAKAAAAGSEPSSGIHLRDPWFTLRCQTTLTQPLSVYH